VQAKKVISNLAWVMDIISNYLGSVNKVFIDVFF